MPRRRWLQFSFRGFLIALTIGCLWLGWQVERAREQREAVKAIEALGGAVSYDWEPEPLTHSALLASVRKRERTKWLREIVGDDFFQAVEKEKGVRTIS